jgi:alkylhydroperoxidase family enzyme
MAYIKTIDPRDAEGPLKDEYDAAVRRAGRVYQILQVQSLNHETLHRSLGLYLASMHGPSGLTRTEREMLAVVVSRANDCFY